MVTPQCFIAVIASLLLACSPETENSPAESSKTTLTAASIAESEVAADIPTLKKLVARRGIVWGAPVYVRIFKKEKKLELWMEKGKTFELFRTYTICYFSGVLGPKLKEGDKQAPEGFYYVPRSGMNPDSKYHLAFNIGYPNTFDQLLGRTGSDIMVHGECASIGCFAMGNPNIEEIYNLCDAALSKGQPFFRVHIFPFRMTQANMKAHRTHRWYSFWQNLQEGYTRFQQTKHPPEIRMEGGRYVVE